MKILISGGSGLIGAALSENLIREGNQVKVLSRNPGKINHLPEEISLVSWDGRTLGEWVSAIDWADAVVNLAGASIAGETPLQMRWTPKRKETILHSRINAGNLLSEAIHTADTPPEAFIQASAIGYYGTENNSSIDETGSLGRDFLADVCWQWEGSSDSLSSLPIRKVIIRIGIVLSRKGGVYPLFKLPFSLFIGGRIGSGNQMMSWIHITDLVNAIIFLLNTRNAQGVYNLTAPRPVSNLMFGSTLSEVINRPSYLPLPDFFLKAALGEVSTLLLDGQEVIPNKLSIEGFHFKFGNLKDAIRDLETIQ